MLQKFTAQHIRSRIRIKNFLVIYITYTTKNILDGNKNTI